MEVDKRLTKVGIFYDGNYFAHVSNYYNYVHEKKARININGLHEYIRKMVSEYEGVDSRYCQIVDAHYFRGRFSAHETQRRNKLMAERIFDDILMNSGIVTHYLPMTSRGEKGIDVWFSLEALELTIFKQFDVVVLIACDSDYLPLVRKLNTLGTRVMVIGWDFEYYDDYNNHFVTATSQFLLREVAYPILMHNVIDDKTKKDDYLVRNLFVDKRDEYYEDEYDEVEDYVPGMGVTPLEDDIERHEGEILSLKQGFGFIVPNDGTENVFFHWGAVNDPYKDFNDLSVGEKVSYNLGRNENGICAIDVEVVEEDDLPLDAELED